jgi:hypothetical protein
MANLNSESYHFLIGFLTPEYLEFLKLHVIPRFTGMGTCILPVPVNRNRGILTSLMLGEVFIKCISNFIRIVNQITIQMNFVNMRAFSIFRCEIINNIPCLFRVAFIFKKRMFKIVFLRPDNILIYGISHFLKNKPI